ncbi:hypothetical protein CBL_01725 [Carabus blaptoides fortunei]
MCRIEMDTNRDFQEIVVNKKSFIIRTTNNRSSMMRKIPHGTSNPTEYKVTVAKRCRPRETGTINKASLTSALEVVRQRRVENTGLCNGNVGDTGLLVWDLR